MTARAAAPVLLVAAAFAGCQTTQETSREKARAAKGLAKQEKLDLGAANRDVRVDATTLLRDENGVAAVVELRSRARAAQAGVPIALTLDDKAGRQVYTNTSGGFDDSLVSVPYVPRRARTYWVNNQIVTARPPTKASVRIGRPRVAAPAAVPEIELSRARLDRDNSGVYAGGTIVNRSKITQKRLVITCVARRGGKIVAAGRAIIERLVPGVQKKPVRWRVYFIGNPKGAKLELSAPPTTLR